MPLRLFATAPPLDEASVDWIFDVYGWALQHLDARYFAEQSLLLIPTNAHFPGRASNEHEMAALMFNRTLEYAGMSHWPIDIQPVQTMLPAAPVIPVRPNPLRAVKDKEPSAADAEITVPYDAAMIKNPEAMIAGFAQVLAHYLGASVQETPPGGVQNWPQTTEVLGVFLGFGLMFANTAFTFKSNTCGSCGGPPVERQVNLSQYDITYALALFCELKSIPNREVLPHLKRSLRPHFKRCRKDLGSRTRALQALRTTDAQNRA